MTARQRTKEEVVSINKASLFLWLIQELGPKGFIDDAIRAFKILYEESADSKLTFDQQQAVVYRHYYSMLERQFCDANGGNHGPPG